MGSKKTKSSRAESLEKLRDASIEAYVRGRADALADSLENCVSEFAFHVLDDIPEGVNSEEEVGKVIGMFFHFVGTRLAGLRVCMESCDGCGCDSVN